MSVPFERLLEAVVAGDLLADAGDAAERPDRSLAVQPVLEEFAAGLAESLAAAVDGDGRVGESPAGAEDNHRDARGCRRVDLRLDQIDRDRRDDQRVDLVRHQVLDVGDLLGRLPIRLDEAQFLDILDPGCRQT